ncbi:hypothetical protein F5Y18DRAFT_438136 [Xylariaceae sp. FL1019]|nr:hypothetical protein F5Y18DRAFT_438136 [Xylariaceae sp. FL1019]
MRFARFSTLAASVISLSQGLVLPLTSPAVKSRDAVSLLGEIVTRQIITCVPGTLSADPQCTTCPNITLGGNVLTLTRRVDAVEVPMNAMAQGQWSAGTSGILETGGLSACTVILVYDQNNFIMAHVPPAREGKYGQLAADNQDLINEYTTKIGNAFKDYTWDQPQGYILMSTMLNTDLQHQLTTWMDGLGVWRLSSVYSPWQVWKHSGNFVASREARPYPPIITFDGHNLVSRYDNECHAPELCAIL